MGRAPIQRCVKIPPNRAGGNVEFEHIVEGAEGGSPAQSAKGLLMLLCPDAGAGARLVAATQCHHNQPGPPVLAAVRVDHNWALRQSTWASFPGRELRKLLLSRNGHLSGCEKGRMVMPTQRRLRLVSRLHGYAFFPWPLFAGRADIFRGFPVEVAPDGVTAKTAQSEC